MNREEILPEGLQIDKPELELFLYFTGRVPHEFGYVLKEGSTIIDEQIVGTLQMNGFFSILRDFLSKKVSEVSTIEKLLLETKFKNRQLL